jgi:hypothetical protein
MGPLYVETGMFYGDPLVVRVRWSAGWPTHEKVQSIIMMASLLEATSSAVPWIVWCNNPLVSGESQKYEILWGIATLMGSSGLWTVYWFKRLGTGGRLHVLWGREGLVLWWGYWAFYWVPWNWPGFNVYKLMILARFYHLPFGKQSGGNI